MLFKVGSIYIYIRQDFSLFPHLRPFLISFMVSVEVKHHERRRQGLSELRSRVKVEVAVLGFPSLINLKATLERQGFCVLI